MPGLGCSGILVPVDDDDEIERILIEELGSDLSGMESDAGNDELPPRWDDWEDGE